MSYFPNKYQRYLNNGYIIFYIFLIFGFSRGYYFWLSDYQLASMVYDSSWWLSIENTLNNLTLETNEYYKIRIDTRLPIEIIIHKLILSISGFFSFSLIRTNLYITSSICIMFIFTAFYVGKKELKSSFLGLIYSYCCLQTAYSVWLSFPIFVPKLIGFTLYPLGLYALTTRIEKTNFWHTFFLIFWAILYPISLIYCLPSIIVGSIFYYYIFKEDYLNLNLQLLGIILVVLGISIGISFSHMSSYSATSMDVFSIFYGSYSNSLSSIFKYYGFYFLYLIIFLLCCISDFFFKISKNKRFYLYMLIALISIISSFVCYFFQGHISFFRTTWFWRSVFYSNIPAIMGLFLFLKEIFFHLSLQKNKRYMAFLFISLFISILCTFNGYFKPSLNLFRTFDKIKSIFFQGEKEIKIEKDFFNIIQILKKQNENVRLLMPPLNLQTGFTDTIEASIPYICLLSRGDSYNFIFQTPLTKEYVEMNDRYTHLLKMHPNNIDTFEELNLFMKNLNVYIVLLPRKINVISPLFKPLYLGSEWGLYIRKLN